MGKKLFSRKKKKKDNKQSRNYTTTGPYESRKLLIRQMQSLIAKKVELNNSWSDLEENFSRIYEPIPYESWKTKSKKEILQCIPSKSLRKEFESWTRNEILEKIRTEGDKLFRLSLSSSSLSSSSLSSPSSVPLTNFSDSGVIFRQHGSWSSRASSILQNHESNYMSRGELLKKVISHGSWSSRSSCLLPLEEQEPNFRVETSIFMNQNSKEEDLETIKTFNASKALTDKKDTKESRLNLKSVLQYLDEVYKEKEEEEEELSDFCSCSSCYTVSNCSSCCNCDFEDLENDKFDVRVNDLNTLHRSLVLKKLRNENVFDRKDIEVEIALRDALANNYEALSNLSIGHVYVPMEGETSRRDTNDTDTLESIDSLIFEPKVPSLIIVEEEEEDEEDVEKKKKTEKKDDLVVQKVEKDKSEEEFKSPGKTTFAERVKLFQNLGATSNVVVSSSTLVDNYKPQKITFQDVFRVSVSPRTLSDSAASSDFPENERSTLTSYSEPPLIIYKENESCCLSLCSQCIEEYSFGSEETKPNSYNLSFGTGSWDYIAPDLKGHKSVDLRQLLKDSFGLQQQESAHSTYPEDKSLDFDDAFSKNNSENIESGDQNPVTSSCSEDETQLSKKTSQQITTDSEMGDSGIVSPSHFVIPKRDTMIRELKTKLKEKFAPSSSSYLESSLEEEKETEYKISVGTVASGRMVMGPKLKEIFENQRVNYEKKISFKEDTWESSKAFESSTAKDYFKKPLSYCIEESTFEEHQQNHCDNRELLYGPGGPYGPTGPFTTPDVRYPQMNDKILIPNSPKIPSTRMETYDWTAVKSDVKHSSNALQRCKFNRMLAWMTHGKNNESSTGESYWVKVRDFYLHHLW